MHSINIDGKLEKIVFSGFCEGLITRTQLESDVSQNIKQNHGFGCVFQQFGLDISSSA
jgi:hypothetical protein